MRGLASKGEAKNREGLEQSRLRHMSIIVRSVQDEKNAIEFQRQAIKDSLGSSAILQVMHGSKVFEMQDEES